jgi:type IV fimbrial biogenesis protein FimT
MEKGFTLIEFLIVVAIIVILSTFAIPAWDRFMEINRFNSDIMAVEYTINRAKITAMSKTTNVGICVDNNRILIYDVGFPRGSNPCSGTLLFASVPKGVNTRISSIGSVIFDPRGFDILLGGTICIYNTELNTYYRIIISRGAQRVEKGEGGC